MRQSAGCGRPCVGQTRLLYRCGSDRPALLMLQEKDNVLDSRLTASGQFSNLNLICYTLNGGIRQGLIERSIGAPDQCWFYERAMGSTCGVHEVTYRQFSNLKSINNIQISNFNFLKLYPCSSLLTIFGRERWGALALYIMLC